MKIWTKKEFLTTTNRLLNENIYTELQIFNETLIADKLGNKSFRTIKQASLN